MLSSVQTLLCFVNNEAGSDSSYFSRARSLSPYSPIAQTDTGPQTQSPANLAFIFALRSTDGGNRAKSIGRRLKWRQSELLALRVLVWSRPKWPSDGLMALQKMSGTSTRVMTPIDSSYRPRVEKRLARDPGCSRIIKFIARFNARAGTTVTSFRAGGKELNSTNPRPA